MKINLLTVGEIEDEHIDALVRHYCRRIEHYYPMQMTAVKAEKIVSLTTQEVLQREWKRVQAKLTDKEYVIVLDREGRSYPSEGFSRLLDQLAQQSIRQITFIIGGPLGLSEQIKARSNERLSLSKMTFPHEMAALFLLEQIFRACTILRGPHYHK